MVGVYGDVSVRRCKIESKFFHFLCGGKLFDSFQITEEGPRWADYVCLGNREMVWFVRCFEEVIRDESHKHFYRFMREGKQLWSMSGRRNRGGRFLVLRAFYDGTNAGAIFIPAGKQKRGWFNFLERLKICFLYPWQRHRAEELRKAKQKTVLNESWRQPNIAYSEVVKKGAIAKNHGNGERSLLQNGASSGGMFFPATETVVAADAGVNAISENYGLLRQNLKFKSTTDLEGRNARQLYKKKRKATRTEYEQGNKQRVYTLERKKGESYGESGLEFRGQEKEKEKGKGRREWALSNDSIRG